SAVTHQRSLDPVAPVHPAIVHPAVVTDEVAVDLEVGARTEPNDHIVASVNRDIAALGTAGADTGALVQIPGPGLMEEILGQERADRTEVYHVAGPRMIQTLLG